MKRKNRIKTDRYPCPPSHRGSHQKSTSSLLDVVSFEVHTFLVVKGFDDGADVIHHLVVPIFGFGFELVHLRIELTKAVVNILRNTPISWSRLGTRRLYPKPRESRLKPLPQGISETFYV